MVSKVSLLFLMVLVSLTAGVAIEQQRRQNEEYSEIVLSILIKPLNLPGVEYNETSGNCYRNDHLYEREFVNALEPASKDDGQDFGRFREDHEWERDIFEGSVGAIHGGEVKEADIEITFV